MITATIFEAKTNLSKLIKRAQNGEEVVITSGRDHVPVARIEPIKPKGKRRLGFMYTPGFVLTDAFWEPLPEEAPRLWEGGDDKGE
jgi:prevent-host-death family protein